MLYIGQQEVSHKTKVLQSKSHETLDKMEPELLNEKVLKSNRQETCFLWNIAWWLFLNYEIKLASILKIVKLKSTVVMDILRMRDPAFAVFVQYYRNVYDYGLPRFVFILLRLPITLKQYVNLIVVVRSFLLLNSSRFCFISIVNYLNEYWLFMLPE